MVNRWIPEGLRSLRGITPDEVMQALDSPRRMPRSGSSGGVRVLTIWARTLTGRPLIVVIRRTGSLHQRILTAREMGADELASFEAWEAMTNG